MSMLGEQQVEIELSIATQRTLNWFDLHFKNWFFCTVQCRCCVCTDFSVYVVKEGNIDKEQTFEQQINWH